MKTFIITPFKDGMKAPGIAVDVQNNNQAYYNAIAEAKKRSRLSDFDGWSFA